MERILQAYNPDKEMSSIFDFWAMAITIMVASIVLFLIITVSVCFYRKLRLRSQIQNIVQKAELKRTQSMIPYDTANINN